MLNDRSCEYLHEALALLSATSIISDQMQTKPGPRTKKPIATTVYAYPFQSLELRIGRLVRLRPELHPPESLKSLKPFWIRAQPKC
jgi:hypothetical protein